LPSLKELIIQGPAGVRPYPSRGPVPKFRRQLPVPIACSSGQSRYRRGAAAGSEGDCAR